MYYIRLFLLIISPLILYYVFGEARARKGTSNDERHFFSLKFEPLSKLGEKHEEEGEYLLGVFRPG